MARKKNVFVCRECGADYSKWQGQCVACEAWNTLDEVRVPKKGDLGQRVRNFTGNPDHQVSAAAPEILSNIQLQEISRIVTGVGELDRVLGGGLVPGSVVLLGGNPGAGKSTLLLQIACELASSAKILYVSGEESVQQVALRAKRLSLPRDDLSVLSETNLYEILESVRKMQPNVLVIDSIQVMFLEELSSAPGGVSQVRECAAILTQFAKQTGTALVMVGHVTKDGSLAGPKILEHIVDCSLLLEGEPTNRYRILRSQKNRFGAVNELGVFAMTDQGMREVKNPSAIFLDRRDQFSSGTVITVVWEGTRPLLVEIQALVDSSHLANPRRVAVGLDQTRMSMLLAVLNRHAGINLGSYDIFTNVVGGIRVLETSADLALMIATVSSLNDVRMSSDVAIFGEVGLSGEIRPVPNGQQRLQEASKHGFKRAIIPTGNKPRSPIAGLHVDLVSNLADALSIEL